VQGEKIKKKRKLNPHEGANIWGGGGEKKREEVWGQIGPALAVGGELLFEGGKGASKKPNTLNKGEVFSMFVNVLDAERGGVRRCV